jgi:flagellar motor component MotA
VRYNLALTKTEKEFLWRKYKQNGMSSWEAQNKVEGFVTYLDTMVKRLVKQNKSQNHIQDKFQQEFEQMIMKLEV